MGSISSAFNIITSALQANQSALGTVANNVANANTAGYTRETPNFEENSPVTINGMIYGAGISFTGSTSVRDRVLDQRLAQQQQLATASGTRLTELNSLEILFTPATGSSSSAAGDIGSDLTNFFDSFSSLESNPTSNALRQQVLSSAATLAGDMSNGSASLNAQQTAVDQEATGVTSQVNALTSVIAGLNRQIQSLSPESDAGALEDQRVQDISQLSQLIGINQIQTENNGITITTTAGQPLVAQSSSFQLTTGTTNGVTHFYLSGTDITTELASGGGQLGGYLTVRDQDIPSALAALDQLAYSVSTAVNAQNNAGTDLAGDVGNAGNIFFQPVQISGSASGIAVEMTDPNHIAAAGLGAGTGDNSNATILANLSNQTIVNGQTPINYYSAFVSSLGSTISEVQTENTAQNVSLSQLTNLRNALSGVNLNDEAASMQQIERSYQAASQIFNILNSLMANILNLGVQTAVS